MKYLPILVFILGTSFAQIPEKSTIDSLFAKYNQKDVPGCALGIVKGDQLVYSKGYGIADLEHDIPIEPNSVFYIGSVSKQFVTFCILLLEEQGKIGLDDRIQKYLPDFPEYDKPLTIRNFIHHTSGVRDYLTLMSLKGRSYLDNIEIAEAYELIKWQKELNFTPGEKYLYSNSCYFMLAMIVEKAAGVSLREFADKNIFKPLGMKNTLFYDDNRELIKNKVFSYYPAEDGEGYENLIMRFDLVGSGGVYSTVEDMFLWDQNFYNNKLGKGGQKIIDKMHEEGLLNNGKSSGYAFALNNGTYKGLRTVSHGGALAGYRAELMRFPDQEFSVIILANRGDFNPTGMAFDVADVLLKDEFKEEPEPKAVEKKKVAKKAKGDKKKYKLSQMAGRYEVAPGVIAKITVDGDSLNVVQMWNGSSYKIFRAEGNTFEIPNVPNLQFTFSGLKGGHTQALDVLQNGRSSVAKRLPDLDMSKFKEEDFVGDYYSPELDASYSIFKGEEGLAAKLPDNSTYELLMEAKDRFSVEGMTVRFQRKGKVITGFELDAGRVQNLKFEKK